MPQTTLTTVSTLLPQSTRLPLIAVLAVRFAYLVTQWDRNARGRNDLKSLDDHLLEDIGLTRFQADKEADRPFWQM